MWVCAVGSTVQRVGPMPRGAMKAIAAIRCQDLPQDRVIAFIGLGGRLIGKLLWKFYLHRRKEILPIGCIEYAECNCLQFGGRV